MAPDGAAGTVKQAGAARTGGSRITAPGWAPAGCSDPASIPANRQSPGASEQRGRRPRRSPRAERSARTGLVYRSLRRLSRSKAFPVPC